MTDMDMAEGVVTGLSGGLVLTRDRGWFKKPYELHLSLTQIEYFKSKSASLYNCDATEIAGLVGLDERQSLHCSAPTVAVIALKNPVAAGFKQRFVARLKFCAVCGEHVDN